MVQEISPAKIIFEFSKNRLWQIL